MLPPANDHRRALAADLTALVLCAGLALAMLAHALPAGRVFVSRESLQTSLPWSAVLEREAPHNRFVGDQPRIYYPYLVEAARVYAGEADALWTSRGGGGQPFLGNITSSLLHPLTLLAAFVPVVRVPLLQGWLTLTFSAWLMWLFLRRRGLTAGACAFGALAFGFGGHQVLWLQYALSHTLVALPLCFWAVERLVERRSPPRVAVLALGLALFALGGHPETGFVAGLVAGLWALWRLWDHHGRWLVATAAVLALGLSAMQWLPFLEYARQSHGLHLREGMATKLEGGVSLGASLVFFSFLAVSLAMLRASTQRGLLRRVSTVLVVTITVVMARRMGMSMAGGTLVLPQMYGDPVGGGVFTGAEDYPGLNAAFAGVLPPVLLGTAALIGFGGGFLRFCAVLVALLWGAAHHMPGVEGLLRLVPGLSEVGETRLLGPVGFLTAFGGAMMLDGLTSPDAPPGRLAAAGRVAATVALALLTTFVALRIPVDPHGGRTMIAGLRSPDPAIVHGGDAPILICFDLDEPADDLRIQVDGMTLTQGPAAASDGDTPHTVVFLPQRTQEGRHRLLVEAWRDGQLEVLADQPLSISRARQLTTRDLVFVGASLALLGWLVVRPRRGGAWVATAVVALDVLSLGWDYNPSSEARDLYPATRTTSFLREQPGPFRVFSEGTILPPDTQFVVGVDHLLSYDNLGFQRTYQLLIEVPIRMDAFASFSFDRESVGYGSPLFDVLGVRYVLTHPKVDLSDVPGMELVHESETRVWENGGDQGRAFVVGEVRDMLTSPAEELRGVDPRRVGLLMGGYDGPLGGTGSAEVLEHRGGEIDVAVRTDGPALLIVTENRAPGWEAAVDDGPYEPTLGAYAAWQAVPVPAGEHRVHLRYRPASVSVGMTLTALSALVLLLMLVLPRRAG